MAERMTLDAVLARFREEAQGNKAALGVRFERFVRAVLTRVPLYQGQFRRVWLWSELGQGHDTGIDLVAEAHDGALYGIQAKCYEDGHVVSKPDIDTFLARLGAPIVFEGAKRAFAHGLLFSSTDAWGAHVEAELRDRAIPVQVMTLSRLRAIEADWAVLAGFAEGPAVPPKALRDYQAEALANAARHYAAHDRGKLIMACGTGKTFTSLRLVEQETGDKGLALFLVPSIALLNQTLVAWCDDAARPIHAVCVCSDAQANQRARREGDSWVVPFLSAESERHPDAADVMLERYTPYEALGAERVDVPTATVDELEVMTLLSKGEAPAVRAKALVPEEPTPGPDPEAADPESVFDGLVGMDEQKEMLIKLSTALAKHGRSAVECFHFVFVGNPGTGKTELASRLVSYLDSLGVTDGTHKMVKVSGSELMADYVGQTGNKVRRIVDSAVGGMLFIDEFYSLSAAANNYGREAIDTLTEQLDRCRDDLVCVIAGYPAEVTDTLELNPGLRERFGYQVEFPDYTSSQLVQIFCRMAGDRGFTVACVDALSAAVDALRRSEGFSNARTMRKLVDHAVVEASWVRDEAVIEEADLERALPQCLSAPVRRRAGF